MVSVDNIFENKYLKYTKLSVSFLVIGVFIFIYTWSGRNEGGESGLAILVVASQVIMVLSFLVLLFSLVGAKKSFDAIKRENRNSQAWTCLYINLTCFTCMIVVWLSLYGLYWFKSNNASPRKTRVINQKSRTAVPKKHFPVSRPPVEINTSTHIIKALPPPPRKDGAESGPGTSKLWHHQPLEPESGDNQK